MTQYCQKCEQPFQGKIRVPYCPKCNMGHLDGGKAEQGQNAALMAAIMAIPEYGELPEVGGHSCASQDSSYQASGVQGTIDGDTATFTPSEATPLYAVHDGTGWVVSDTFPERKEPPSKWFRRFQNFLYLCFAVGAVQLIGLALWLLEHALIWIVVTGAKAAGFN